MEPPWCCCSSCEDDPDAFDGRAFMRSRVAAHAAQGICVRGVAALSRGLSCQPCSGEATGELGDLNPDPQKNRFESTKGRWGESKSDQFSKPADERRDVVAQGMSRFEIGKIAPQQPRWEQLAPNVLCVLAFNPSAFTLNGTCCYLVGTGKRRFLIDTGEDDFGHVEFMEALDDCMTQNGIEGLEAILITHMHHDHYGGIPGLLKKYGIDTPVSKIPNPPGYWNTVAAVKERGLLPYLEHEDGTPRFKPTPGTPRDSPIPPDCMVEWPDEEAEAGKPLSWDAVQRTKTELIRDFWFVKRSYWFQQQLDEVWNFQPLSHGDVLHTEGASLVAYHTPGHAYDHCSYWLQENKSLFSGDHVLGWGTTFMMDLYDYMRTLEFMIALKPKHLFPGHGPMIEDGIGLLERYIVHRKEREDQVEDALLQSSVALSTRDIVNRIYTNTPAHRLWMANENVSKVLRKFDKSGIAKAFVLQSDGTLERFDFPQNWMMIRRLPENLVWLHRFHFRVEAREGQPASASSL